MTSDDERACESGYVYPQWPLTHHSTSSGEKADGDES